MISCRKVLRTAWAVTCMLNCTLFRDAHSNDLDQLNELFRNAYKVARTHELQKLGPILVVNGDQFELVWNSYAVHKIWNLDLRKYHQLKAMAHVPPCIYLLSKDSDQAMQLKALGQLLKKSLGELETLSFEDSQIQSELEHQTSQYIDQNIGLEDYMEAARPLIEANILAAVRHQLEIFEKTIQEVAQVISEIDHTALAELRVIILGPLQARDQNLQMQFFREYLQIEEEDRARLLYAENINQSSTAIDLLGTVVLDRQISKDLLRQEHRRMERDLLGAAAKEFLRDRKQLSKPSVCPYMRKKQVNVQHKKEKDHAAFQTPNRPYRQPRWLRQPRLNRSAVTRVVRR